MQPMDTNQGGETPRGRNQPSVDDQETGFMQRRSDRREDGGLFGYQGPERRSGDDRRQGA